MSRVRLRQSLGVSLLMARPIPRPDVPSTCPYCDVTCRGLKEEVAHMQAEHPDVIAERLTRGGFRKDFRKENDKWVDMWSDPES